MEGHGCTSMAEEFEKSTRDRRKEIEAHVSFEAILETIEVRRSITLGRTIERPLL